MPGSDAQQSALARFLVDRRFRLPRLWSNEVLRIIGPNAVGDVVNVSAWLDSDKEGRRYRDYFPNATNYHTTNYGGYRGAGISDSLELDLESELPREFEGKFDVVFSHTTLEHVFDVFRATANLCRMSRDAVIVVVPAVQEEHVSDSFSDYWRFTSHGLSTLFERNGLTPVLITSSPYSNAAIYHLIVASRKPERWREAVAAVPYPINSGPLLVQETYVKHLLRRLAAALKPASRTG